MVETERTAIPLKDKYMTGHCPSMEQIHIKVSVLNQISEYKHSILVMEAKTVKCQLTRNVGAYDKIKMIKIFKVPHCRNSSKI